MFYSTHPVLTSERVPRFGVISPLMQKYLILWLIFAGLFPIWQNVKPTWANLVHHKANFRCC